MKGPLQQFIDDIGLFLADLKSLGDRRAAHEALLGYWADIRHDDYRKIPLLLAVAVHCCALLLAVAAPFLKGSAPALPEVYTVNLYSAPEAAPPPQPAAAAAPAPVAPPAPKTVAAAPKPALPEVVSLSPIRQRLEKEHQEKEQRIRQEEQLSRKMAEVRLGILKNQADKAAREAHEAAREAAREAVSSIAALHKTTSQAQSPGAETGTTPTAEDASAEGTSAAADPRIQEALDRYRDRLIKHISPHWQLPELQNWDETLRAVIMLKVKRDGTVTSSYFEKRSSDLRFNQYVRKAIENAQPLPPFPLEFDQKSEEIAVTFSPGGLM